MQRSGRIFISYRNDDEPFGAALVDYVLSARLGDRVVFRASKSVRLGDDYVETLTDGIRHASIVLVVVGSRWSAGPARPGPIDWVRYEIAEAFRRRLRVIPVLLNADLPVEAELPPDIAQLARCQYARIRARHSRLDIERLADEVAQILADHEPDPVHRVELALTPGRRPPAVEADLAGNARKATTLRSLREW